MAYAQTAECRGCHRDRTVGASGLCSTCFERFTNRRPPIRQEPEREIARRAAVQRRLAARRRAREVDV